MKRNAGYELRIIWHVDQRYLGNDILSHDRSRITNMLEQGINTILTKYCDEDEIVKKSVTLTKILWKENYRRVEPHEDQPLQDGTI